MEKGCHLYVVKPAHRLQLGESAHHLFCACGPGRDLGRGKEGGCGPGLAGYAGIDFLLGERPWAADVNPRPTTSIIGIARVMQEEIGKLILKAKFGGMPEEVYVTGRYRFEKGELG